MELIARTSSSSTFILDTNVNDTTRHSDFARDRRAARVSVQRGLGYYPSGGAGLLVIILIILLLSGRL